MQLLNASHRGPVLALLTFAGIVVGAAWFLAARERVLAREPAPVDSSASVTSEPSLGLQAVAHAGRVSTGAIDPTAVEGPLVAVGALTSRAVSPTCHARRAHALENPGLEDTSRHDPGAPRCWWIAPGKAWLRVDHGTPEGSDLKPGGTLVVDMVGVAPSDRLRVHVQRTSDGPAIVCSGPVPGGELTFDGVESGRYIVSLGFDNGEGPDLDAKPFEIATGRTTRVVLDAGLSPPAARGSLEGTLVLTAKHLAIELEQPIELEAVLVGLDRKGEEARSGERTRRMGLGPIGSPFERGATDRPFHWSGLAPGSYSLEIAPLGITRTCVVAPGETLRIELDAEPPALTRVECASTRAQGLPLKLCAALLDEHGDKGFVGVEYRALEKAWIVLSQPGDLQVWIDDPAWTTAATGASVVAGWNALVVAPEEVVNVELRLADGAPPRTASWWEAVEVRPVSRNGALLAHSKPRADSTHARMMVRLAPNARYELAVPPEDRSGHWSKIEFETHSGAGESVVLHAE